MYVYEAIKIIEDYSKLNESGQGDMQEQFDEAIETLKDEYSRLFQVPRHLIFGKENETTPPTTP